MTPEKTFADANAMATTLNEIAICASRALGVIDRDGHRGITSLSVIQIDAMAVMLTLLGLVPTPPGSAPPTTLLIPVTEEA